MNQKKVNLTLDAFSDAKLTLPQLDMIVGGSNWYITGYDRGGTDACTVDIALCDDKGGIIEQRCALSDAEAEGMTEGYYWDFF
jgi:hypothetical protein